MTIDEAIRHCDEVAERYDRVEDSHADDGLKQECIQCAEDHRQLAEWLKDYKEAKRLLKQICCDFSNDAAVRLDHLNEALQFLKLIGEEKE